MKIYLFRHAQKQKIISRDSRNRIGITVKGQKQAEECGRMLKNKNISAIFSSPFLRSKESAKIIGKELHIIPQVIEELKEVPIQIYLLELCYAVLGKSPEGSRIFDRMRNLIKTEGNAVIIAHGGVARAIAASLEKSRIRKLIKLMTPYYNLGLTEIEDDGKWKLKSFNSINYMNATLVNRMPI